MRVIDAISVASAIAVPRSAPPRDTDAMKACNSHLSRRHKVARSIRIIIARGRLRLYIAQQRACLCVCTIGKTLKAHQ